MAPLSVSYAWLDGCHMQLLDYTCLAGECVVHHYCANKLQYKIGRMGQDR
jgi:hypothetical protein